MAKDTLQIDTRDRSLRILHIASEAVPWVKTGGLADVVGALCSYLATRGHDVTLVLPLYRELKSGGSDTGQPVADVSTAVGRSLTIHEVNPRDGPRTLFVNAPDLFDREGLYGTARGDHPDNAERFATLVRAALAASAALDNVPEVVHAHDWQAALAPVYLRYMPPGGERARTASVLTLHNLAYQGVFPATAFETTGLPAEAAERLTFGNHISYLKAGLVTADRVTTVSPRYAREIATPEFGFGLERWVAGLDRPVAGILNGIDTAVWNPEADPHLPCRYSADDLAGKRVCKAALQEELGLPVDPEIPLFGMVSRLVDQKGLGLIEALGEDLARLPAQFTFLGTGDARHESMLAGLALTYDNVTASLQFSEDLAHRIEAGADFFLMPSAFEPSGLNQMISQRYGTPPIVHRVGGLADSVTHATREAIAARQATGVVFEHFDPPALRWALEFALDLYRDPASLQAVRRAGMERDFSWARSGRQYETLYAELVDETRGAT